MGTIDQAISPNIILGNNHWYRAIINKLEQQAMNTLLSIPKSAEPGKWVKWALSNWFTK